MADNSDILDQSRDRFQESFQDRTVLITGGTGFVGKVFLEKILRMTDVKKIYVLVRTKKDKPPQQRFLQVFGNPLFELVKKQKGQEIVRKVQFINGDASALNLGLSEEDRNVLIEEVEFIYHCAATIRFDEALKQAVLLNVRGTKLVLELAKQCKKISVFCYLSTAYCHLNERVLHEKAYSPPADPHNIIKICELLDNDAVNTIAPTVLKDIPNSYAFTKALGEALVTDEASNLPIILLRPSIIMPIWKDPIPGWTDNFNGPMGLLIAAGKGVLRTMYCKADAYADYIPVDIVANSMMAATMDRLVYKERQIYNITSSAEYKVTFKEITDLGRKTVLEKVPFNGVFWYPGGSLKTSRLAHNLAFFFTQWVPAVVVDILLVLLGYKPVLKRVQRRIMNGYEVFEYYTNRQWDFENDGTMLARKLLTQTEAERYKLDGDGIVYDNYVESCIRSSRLYILNETDETLPAARRHMTVMWLADRIGKLFLILGFFYLLWTYIVTPLLNIL